MQREHVHHRAHRLGEIECLGDRLPLAGHVPDAGDDLAGAALQEERGYVGFDDAIEVEHIIDPTDWERQGMADGSPFASAHSFLQTGPFRPKNIWGDNIVFAGSGTTPGVGVPMVLISGRLAAERITGPDPSYRSRAMR